MQYATCHVPCMHAESPQILYNVTIPGINFDMFEECDEREFGEMCISSIIKNIYDFKITSYDRIFNIFEFKL